MKKYFTIFLFLAFMGSSCFQPSEQIDPIGEIEGLKPIYVDAATVENIRSLPPQPIRQLGKIYYKDAMMFVSEVARGIHIIDNSDPVHPQKIKFIEVQGSRDIAIKGNILYTDNITDLVALDISDLDNIKEVNRVRNLYSKEDFEYPQNHEGFFECYDPARGVVIEWEEAILNNPECWR